MAPWFPLLKTELASHIHRVLDAVRPDFTRIAPGLGGEALDALAEYACRGKLIRGCLVNLGYELCGKDADDASIRDSLRDLGAAMELLQSALLIHDDIMDRDLLRRGKPAMHAHYSRLLEDAGVPDSAHQGEALAICLGDIALFAAWHAIDSLPLDSEIVRALSRTAGLELGRVGLAQMLDVAHGAIPDALVGTGAIPSFFPLPGASPADGDSLGAQGQRIENIYRFKTGRYTFSLPLALGAIAAGADPASIRSLEEAGEELGLVFQIKDDELGIWANEEELGKSVGIDIRENKKTLHRLELFRTLAGNGSNGANSEAKNKIQSILATFGKIDASDAEIDRVRTTMEDLGIRETLRTRMGEYAAHAAARLAPILENATPRARSELDALVTWNLERQK